MSQSAQSRSMAKSAQSATLVPLHPQRQQQRQQQQQHPPKPNQRWLGLALKVMIPAMTFVLVLTQIPSYGKATQHMMQDRKLETDHTSQPVALNSGSNQLNMLRNMQVAAAEPTESATATATAAESSTEASTETGDSSTATETPEIEDSSTETTSTTTEPETSTEASAETGDWATASTETTAAAVLPFQDNRTKNATAATPTVTPLAILTAVTENHALESEVMLKTLAQHQYQGPMYYFLMCRNGRPGASKYPKLKQSCDEWRERTRTELPQKIPLNFIFVDFEITDPTKSYCFKPKAVAHYLEHYYNQPIRAQALLWADASARLHHNPADGAANMIQDRVDFVGEGHSWRVPMQTHNGTWQYYNADPTAFSKTPSMIATYFMINLEKQTDENKTSPATSTVPPNITYSAQQRHKQYHLTHRHNSTLPQTFTTPFESILVPWMDCAVLACTTCMAPPGSRKDGPPEQRVYEGPVKYLGHRQDQAILALLVRHYEKNKYHSKTRRLQMIRTIQSTRSRYLDVHHFRGVEEEDDSESPTKQ